MKKFAPTINNYAFRISFIAPLDKTFGMEVKFSTTAPHYEAAVAQALVHGQQILRDAQKQYGQILFMRICRA